LVHDSLKVVTQNSLLLSVASKAGFASCVAFWSRFLIENTKTLVRVGIVDGASLGLELGLVEGLSLGETDALGLIDGVAVGWSVGWFDFIDGVELINLTLANDRTIEGHASDAKALHTSGSQCFAD
jgi:hypothetical protein